MIARRKKLKNSRLSTPFTQKITREENQDPSRVIFFMPKYYSFVSFCRSYLRIFPWFPQCHHKPEYRQPKQNRRFYIEDTAHRGYLEQPLQYHDAVW